MKLAKKLMGCALALVALSMMGCVPNAGDDIMDFNAPSGKATIDHTNDDENGNNQRAWNVFNTKHTSANCKISISKDSTSNSGNMGFIFGLSEVEDENGDKVNNFYLLTFRYDSSQSNKIKYYLSYFENVHKDYLSSGNNFKDKNGVEIGKNNCLAKETQVIPKTGIWASASNSVTPDSEAFYNIYVSLTLDENNGYTIEAKNDSKQDIISKQTNLTNTLVKYDNNGKEDSTGKYIANYNQDFIGAYAMVGHGATLKGKWEFSDFVNSLDVE